MQISDDEDDTHPNIDTPSLFRWRHQARVERMEKLEKEKQEIASKRRQKLEELEKVEKETEINESVQEKIKNLKLEMKDLEKKEEELKKQERVQPWNVDTIGKESWSKTVLNKPKPRLDRSNMTEEEREQLYKEFVSKNEKRIKHYGMLSKWEDCKLYLMEHPELGK